MKLRVKGGLESLTDEQRHLLAEYQEVLQENPLQGFSANNSKQRAFLEARQKVQAFFGGNRAGKTTALVVKALCQVVDPASLPEPLRAIRSVKTDRPAFGRIIAPDFTSTMEGVVLPTFRQWAPKQELKGGTWEKAWDKQLRTLRMRDGSWIQFMTYEQDLDKFGGAALDFIGYDEEPPEQIRKECRIRLIDRAGFEMFAMTPLLGLSWMYDAVWEQRGSDRVFCVTAAMDENPHINQAEKTEALDGLTKEEIQARRYGKFVHFQGLVYPEYTDDRHSCPPPTREHVSSLDVVVGIDPGVRWTGASFVGFDNENAALVFDEMIVGDATVTQVADEIKRKLRRWGVPDPLFVIDPSARNRNLTNAENVEGAYLREGIYTVHGQNSLEAGVFDTKRRLQAKPPALFVSRDCQRLLWEFGRYRKDERPDGSFAVVKKDDHVLDSCRYALMSRPWVDNPQDKPKVRGLFDPWPHPFIGDRSLAPLGDMT